MEASVPLLMLKEETAVVLYDHVCIVLQFLHLLSLSSSQIRGSSHLGDPAVDASCLHGGSLRQWGHPAGAVGSAAGHHGAGEPLPAAASA